MELAEEFENDLMERSLQVFVDSTVSWSDVLESTSCGSKKTSLKLTTFCHQFSQTMRAGQCLY